MPVTLSNVESVLLLTISRLRFQGETLATLRKATIAGKSGVP